MKKYNHSRIISHRGNLNGVTEFENRPEYVLKASELCDVEIDVWFDGIKFYTGHDAPMYEIDKFFLLDKNYLIHAKNELTFQHLYKYSQLEIFFQTTENIVLTNQGRLLFNGFYEGEIPDNLNNIYVDLRLDKKELLNAKLSSVLTDYPLTILNKTIGNSIQLPFDVLILDVDGVLTDGTKIYNNLGEIVGKNFLDRDFTAMKQFMSLNVLVIWLSSDSFNEKIANSRGIHFFYGRGEDGQIDKSRVLTNIVRHFDLTGRKIAYVGDDYYDLTLLDTVDFPFIPRDGYIDAPSKIIRLEAKAGKGVVSEIYAKYFNRFLGGYTYDDNRQIR